MFAARVSFMRVPLAAALIVLLSTVPAPKATAQGAGAPGAVTAATGPRLPPQHHSLRTALPGERSESRVNRVASGATVHLSTLAIVVGVVILALLLF